MLVLAFYASPSIANESTSSAVLDLAETAALDLTEEEILESPYQASIVEASEKNSDPYMLTGNALYLQAKKVFSYMAVSQINPVAVATNNNTDQYFKDVLNRPMTWPEASAACSGYKLAGKEWTLPSITQLDQINRRTGFAEQVLDEAKTEGEPIRRNLTQLKDRKLDQFNYFWSNEAGAKPTPGLKQAAVFGGKGRLQAMSEARYLNVICVTYFTGPPAEIYKTVDPATKNQTKPAKG